MTQDRERDLDTLLYSDLADISIEDLDVLLDIYAEEFGSGPTSFPREEFKKSLLARRHEGRPYGYHFLCIRSAPDKPPRGMASFFTFPGAGFGGYIVLERSLRGHGLLVEIIRTIERYMVADGRGARGWYAECDPADGTAPIFAKRGFHEVDVEYRQPPLHGQPTYPFTNSPILHLMYKSIGDMENLPRVRTADFLYAIEWIFRIVYRIEDPTYSPYYQHLFGQLSRYEWLLWR